ncbi:MAG: hypothetical protein WC815_01350 [Vicinamibacterales bacterium]|jgi:hypothetical protein
MIAAITRLLLVSGCICAAAVAAAQSPPQLSKDQRTLLQAIVLAVDAAASQPARNDSAWPVHVMRASDGSHYVAFSVEPEGAMRLPAGPVMLYVRLATATPGVVTTMTERSVIRDWLVGRRVDPRMLPGRGIAIGEMPAFGPGAIGVRGSTPSTGSMDLKLMALERERARQEQETRDKQRRAELEGKAVGLRDLLPFEDFDLASSSIAGDGTRQISRAFTAGPGEYNVYVGWTDLAAPKPAAAIHVMKRALSLPPATILDLTLSSVIVADAVAARAAPYPPAQQAAHPYAIGSTDITPARDTVFTRDERLAVAFQIINARPNVSGKPDVTVGFRIVRIDGDREVQVASLNSQSYTEATMPADFDLRLGHPLFAAVAAPLATVPRGDYRLKIAVNDRVAGTARTAEAEFRVVGTPLSLLTEAPPLGPPFRREAALDARVLSAVVQALTPPAPSPALRRALDTAAAGKFIDLLVEEPVAQAEQGARTGLTGLALYSVGDASAVVQFQRAMALGAPAGPLQFLTGAVRATQNRDPDAITAWLLATEAGLPSSVAAPFLVDAYLRRGDGTRAAAMVSAELAGRPADGPWTRALAATHLATGRDRDAIAVLDARLAQAPDDADARWLLLQALYGSIVRGTNPPGSRADGDRFMTLARAYLAESGPHSALVAEWVKAVQNLSEPISSWAAPAPAASLPSSASTPGATPR